MNVYPVVIVEAQPEPVYESATKEDVIALAIAASVAVAVFAWASRQMRFENGPLFVKTHRRFRRH